MRTSAQYQDLIRDGREVWIDGQRVPDTTSHPMFNPIVGVFGFERALGYVKQAAHLSDKVLAQGRA